MQCDVHIFLLIFFALYNYLLFFESDHIRFQHRFKHIFVHVKEFFVFFQKLKNQRYPFEEDTSICDVCIFNFADFSLSCFEVAVWFSKYKF